MVEYDYEQIDKSEVDKNRKTDCRGGTTWRTAFLYQMNL